jgi:hypothetical protein
MAGLLPELTDRIIDHLSDDKPALNTCGLVCRQWFPRSRVHLFFEVKLQVGQRGFHNHVLHDTADRFFDLVDTSFFDIIATVRRLSLFYGTAEGSLAKAHLLRFASCRKLVEFTITLSFSSSDLLVPLHAQLAVVGPKFSSLSSFSLYFYGSSLDSLLGVLACLPTVETLSINGHDIENWASPGPASLLPPRVRSLDMSILRGAEFLFQYLLSRPTIHLFRSLTFDNDEMELSDTAPVAVYLQRAGHALESLSITIWGDSGKPPYSMRISPDQMVVLPGSFEQVALQACTGLRHLYIFSYIQTPSSYPVDILSAVTSNNMLTIKISSPAEEFNPEALDQALALPPFRNLRSVSLGTRTSESLFTPEIRARMPLASARGILE